MAIWVIKVCKPNRLILCLKYVTTFIESYLLEYGDKKAYRARFDSQVGNKKTVCR